MQKRTLVLLTFLQTYLCHSLLPLPQTWSSLLWLDSPSHDIWDQNVERFTTVWATEPTWEPAFLGEHWRLEGLTMGSHKPNALLLLLASGQSLPTAPLENPRPILNGVVPFPPLCVTTPPLREAPVAWPGRTGFKASLWAPQPILRWPIYAR